MNAYRVHYTYLEGEFPSAVSVFMHVAARTWQDARTKAFDEIADRGRASTLEAFGEVYIQNGNTWDLIPSTRRTLTGV